MKQNKQNEDSNVNLLHCIQNGQLEQFPRNLLLFVIVQKVPVLHCLFI